MIKANELRLGNYVALTKEAKEDFQNIIGEKTNDCYDITYFNSDGVDFDGYDFTFNELKPIPLTEEWLLKFGFEKGHKGKLFVILKNNLGYENGRTYFNSSCISESQPKHVHQLQNLYFALTGEELTIK